MATLRPVSRKTLIARLHQFGFMGPFSGGKHQFMRKQSLTVRLPNPHQKDIGIDLLQRILRQCGISKIDWEEML